METNWQIEEIKAVGSQSSGRLTESITIEDRVINAQISQGRLEIIEIVVSVEGSDGKLYMSDGRKLN